MREAFAAVREFGDIHDAYPVIGTKARWWAIRHFFPKLGSQMDKIVLDLRRSRRPEIITPAKPAMIRATSLEFVGRINAAVSYHLSRDHRDDVIGDMVEAVLCGKLKPGDIEKQAPKFVSARFRTDHNKFGDLSLDVPIWADSETNLFDIIPEEQALWR